ncbi:MAG: sugar phosphate isomerase/epimerase, partial [Kiritimatiellae bacterium]|nr:sugar phosphate isomerase/epimerase [Kiritimatiellia bacterium]
MNISRRNFIGGLGAFGALGLAGCACPCCCGPKGKIALQLYSINKYIGGIKDKSGKIIKPGVGLERALEEVAKIGYKGVEFAGYYGFTGKEIKKMLDDNGLVACGSHVGGWRNIDGDNLKKVAEFNLEFGNTVLICPGGTGPDGMNWSNPVWDAKCADHMKFIVDFFNKSAEAAAKFGSRVGIHNHQWEFQLKDENGVTFW